MASTAETVQQLADTSGDADLRLTDELKAQFRQELQVLALRIPKHTTSQYMKMLTKHLFNKPRMRNVLDDPTDPNGRLLLLDETLKEADFSSREVGDRTLAQVVEAEGLEVTSANVQVEYHYWPAHAVLQRLLPEGIEAPCAFESVGHIAHLNLRKELLPYKFIIGQVLLDKNPRLQTVVNKVSNIQNEFRVFPMELLAGKECMETEVRQHGARFKLDFAKVYWNSRLEREHQRLVEQFQPGEVVVDAMAGIGPFAVPAAHKGCTVWANDLNPDSYHYLCVNIKHNRVGGKVLPFNIDGREFMRQAAGGRLDLESAAAVVPAAKPKAPKAGQKQAQQQQQAGAAGQDGGPAAAAATGPDRQQQAQQAQQAQHGGAGSGIFHHIVMNLPAAAVDFLDALRGTFSRELWEGHPLPLVHVYTFTKGEEELTGLRQRVESKLGGELDEEPRLHIVRDVAPKKVMVEVCFRVPPSVAFAAGGMASPAAADEPTKRQRVE